MSGPHRMISIMAKAPIAGQAKTRLIPLLGAGGAATLYQNMLLDTVELAMEALNGHGAVSLVCPTAAHRDVLRKLVPGLVQVIAQERDGLMNGLDYALTHYTRQGYDQVILLDGDSPTLPLSHLRSAFNALSTTTIVLGPTLDGGYYLIGACQPQPALFRWEQLDGATVCNDTRARAEASGHRVTLLPPWYDIDTSEDVDRLVDALRTETGAARRTRQFLVRQGLL